MICPECRENFDPQEDEIYCNECISNDNNDFESIRFIDDYKEDLD